MLSIKSCDLPETAHLAKYKSDKLPGSQAGYTDCYSTTIKGLVRKEDYILAFYTTMVFKLERLLLGHLVNKPSTDEQAKQLVEGVTDTFSAWHIESRSDNQLLMCDFQKRTRCWFMVSLIEDEANPQTVLWFGSAVVPIKDRRTGKYQMGTAFNVLLGFHKLYSRILLYSAKQRLKYLSK